MRINHFLPTTALPPVQACHEARVLRAWAQVLAPRRRPAQPNIFCRWRCARRSRRITETSTASPLPFQPSRRRRIGPPAGGPADGQTVESVLPPWRPVSSSQLLAVRLLRILHDRPAMASSASSAAPRSLPRWRSRGSMRAVRKVVSWAGRAAHNLDNVLEAIELLGIEGAIGHKNLVFSTVGDPRVFDACRAAVKPALALSAAHHPRRAACPPAAQRAADRAEELVERAEHLRKHRLPNPVSNGRRSRGSTDSQEKWTASCACSRAGTRS